MTTPQLIHRVQNYKFFRDGRIAFTPDEIYSPANDAQREILTTLRPIQSQCQLALAPGQEQYSFTKVLITGATNASPIVITAPGNLFNTNDQVIVNGVAGNTAANGNFTVTVITPGQTFSLNSSTGNGVFSGAAGYAYHQIQQAFEMRSVYQTGANTAYTVSGIENLRLDLKTRDEIEYSRGIYGSTSTPDVVNRYYEQNNKEYLIGIQGVPAQAMLLSCVFYLRPLDFQEMQAGIDPVLPKTMDDLLFKGTIKHFLETLPTEEFGNFFEEAEALFDKELLRIREVVTEAQRPRPHARPRMLW